MPGAGKTMTTSFVVDNVQERYDNDNQIGVAYIYCQHLRHAEQTSEYLMTSIFRQLLEKHDTIADEVRTAYKSKKQGKRTLNPEEKSNLLNVVLGLFKKTIVIVDALDELRSAACDEFITNIIFIQQKFNVNIYATSRITKEVAHQAPNATLVEIQARKEDLIRMINSILEPGFLLKNDPDLRRKVLDKILQATNGM
jgi:Cdc6-like AAA superfamily ATPase